MKAMFKKNSRMKRIIILILCFSSSYCQGQNNLVHEKEYKTSQLGEIGEIEVEGSGDINLILIPGFGFDRSVFDSFISRNRNRFRIHIIEAPGFGKFPAPPIPSPPNYNDRPWSTAFESAIVNYIKSKKLSNPYVLGYFDQAVQHAFYLGLSNPELIKGIILVGGEPVRYFKRPEKRLSEDQRIKFVDSLAHNWFASVSKETWINGMFPPQLYSKDSSLADEIWAIPNRIEISVLVQYLCEFFATDITPRLSDLSIPVMVLAPGFSSNLNSLPRANVFKAWFAYSWLGLEKSNRNINIKIIENSNTFILGDAPNIADQYIWDFVNNN